jgi:hypothetical protein
MVCPVCGAGYDKKRCHEAYIRSQKNFVDIVKDNAKRAGKDPKVEWSKAKSRNLILGVKSMKHMYDQICAWQERRKKSRSSL